MTQKPMFQHNRIMWASAIGGALLVVYPTATLAQVAGDGTLGTEVNGDLTAPCTGTCFITNGSTRGSNLFHSFRQFSLPNGDFAGFIIDPTIQTVIVRVTGVGVPFISNINGIIATTDPTATNVVPTNFFLLNPNGIVFGSNAKLFNGGSFLAATAERMLFQDGTQFSNTDPAPLLTVSVPIGLQFGQTPGSIQMQNSQLLAGRTDSFSDFALVGGNVLLDNTIINTPGQRVEIGGAGQNGLVAIDNQLNLDFADSTARSDVSLSNSLVRVTADDKGSIAVNAKNIQMTGRSIIDAGIAPNLGSANSQSGNITLNAAGAVTLLQRSLVRNILFPGAIGNSGNITINADSLQIKEGSQIAAGVLGQGNGGNISVILNNEALIDGSSNSFPSGLLTPIGAGGLGNAGSVTIATKSLTLTNGGQIQTLVSGQGIGGNVAIQSKDAVVLDGTGESQLRSGIFSDIEFGGTGKGGNIEITTGSLGITNGAGIISGAVGDGDAGNVKIRANTTISLDGFSNDNLFNSGIFSNLEGAGRGGAIEVATNSLSITSGAQLSAPTFGRGNAGDVTIQAQKNILLSGKSRNGFSGGVFSSVEFGAEGNGGNIRIETGALSVENGAQLFATTRGRGDAGNITIKAQDFISFIGEGSSALTNVASRGIGNGGNIVISTNSLNINTGAQLVSATFGRGDAGNIQITSANSITIAGASLQSGQPSGLATSTASVSKGGDITISSPFLRLSDGAVLDARTLAEGAGGNININTASFEAINGGQLVSTSQGSGQAGRITINAPNKVTVSGSDPTFTQRAVLLPNLGDLFSPNSGIFVSSQGSGSASNIEINTPKLTLDNQARLNGESASGDGGNIALNIADLMLLRRGSQISTTAGTAQAGGDGGNITINSKFIVSVLSENSDITANAFTGKGGRVDITAQSIFGIQPRSFLTPLSDITASSQFGISGVVTIATLNTDPSRGLVALPINLVDPASQIAQGCRSSGATGRFVVSGRGGLPSTPNDALDSSDLWEDSRVTAQTTETVANLPSSAKIVEATSWVKDATGAIVLVTQPPDSPGYLVSQPAPTHCYVP
ncbi:filamentous hemagglutinin N-terminal domain-containing protein [Phormidesmis sp. 146-12]